MDSSSERCSLVQNTLSLRSFPSRKTILDRNGAKDGRCRRDKQESTPAKRRRACLRQAARPLLRLRVKPHSKMPNPYYRGSGRAPFIVPFEMHLTEKKCKGTAFRWCPGIFDAVPTRFRNVSETFPGTVTMFQSSHDPSPPAGGRWARDATGLQDSERSGKGTACRPVSHL